MTQNSKVIEIRSDHRSGAVKLASLSIDALVSFYTDDKSRTVGDVLQKSANICDEIVKAQPFMASIRTRVYSALNSARKYANTCSSAEEFRRSMLRLLRKDKREHNSMLRGLRKFYHDVIHPHIQVLTYSSSASVFALLKSAADAGIPFAVIVSEARPINEGTVLAKKLAKYKIPVTLVTDIHLAHYIAAAQCMICGADWISETQFTNKVGTQLLVELALKQNIPVYVAAATDKILAQKYYPLSVDSHPASEILKTRSGFIQVKNRYFEATPLADELKFITERGILKAEQIISIAEQTQNEYP